MIIAIDFDGTIVEDRFPEIGSLKEGAREVINKLYLQHTIIIWTCRTGRIKNAAEHFLKRNNIQFHYINESCENNVRKHNNIDTRKVFADIYIDDRNLGFVVDWFEIERQIRRAEQLQKIS